MGKEIAWNKLWHWKYKKRFFFSKNVILGFGHFDNTKKKSAFKLPETNYGKKKIFFFQNGHKKNPKIF